MSQQNLKRLSKVQLLEMLLAQSKRAEELQLRVSQLEERLESRSIAIAQAGDLATACLQVNELFQTAQAAADQYMENIKERCECQLAEARIEADRILQDARQAAARKDGGDDETCPAD